MPSAGPLGHPKDKIPQSPRAHPSPQSYAFTYTSMPSPSSHLQLSFSFSPTATSFTCGQVRQDSPSIKICKVIKLQNYTIRKKSAYPVATLELPWAAAEVRGPAGQESEGGKGKGERGAE